MTSDLEPSRLDALAARARAGDDAALAELFADIRPELVRIAQRTIGRSHPQLDADDVASEVVLRLIDQYKAGTGPVANPMAYLARAIQNRIIDVRRSSSARREFGSDHFVLTVDAKRYLDAEHEQRAVDIGADLAVIRTALQRLPKRDQLILIATVVEGQKPREIAAATDIAANTVSATASRAKKALAVEVRRVLLEQEGGEECARHRDALASGKPSRADSAHEQSCRHCKQALARFAALPSLLALLPLAIVAGLAAQTAASIDPHTDRTSAQRDGRSRPSRVVLAAAGVVSLLLLGIGAIGLLTSNAPGPAEPMIVDGPAQPEASTPAGTPRPSAEPLQLIDLSVDVEVGDAETRVVIVLDIDAGAAVQSINVALPPEMRITDAGAWQCPSNAGGGSCYAPSDASETTLVVASSDGAGADGEATVTVTASDGTASVVAVTTGTLIVRTTER